LTSHELRDEHSPSVVQERSMWGVS
jgi:hypothetical protein